jgi:hypothetical protein
MIALTSAAIDLCLPPAPPRSTRPHQEESRSTSALMPAAGWSCALARRRKAKAMTDGLYVCAPARRPTSARPAAWPPFSHHHLRCLYRSGLHFRCQKSCICPLPE